VSGLGESLLGDGDVGERVRDEQAAVLQLNALKQLLNTRVDAGSQVGHVTPVVRPPQNDVVEYQTSVERVAASQSRTTHTPPALQSAGVCLGRLTYAADSARPPHGDGDDDDVKVQTPTSVVKITTSATTLSLHLTFLSEFFLQYC